MNIKQIVSREFNHKILRIQGKLKCIFLFYVCFYFSTTMFLTKKLILFWHKNLILVEKFNQKASILNMFLMYKKNEKILKESRRMSKIS